MAVYLDAIPRSVVDGGSVRFFPRNDPVISATGYLWSFGDGDTSTEATPIHVYAGTGSYETYDINLTMWYADETNAIAATYVDFIASDLAANVPAVATDGSHMAVSVFLYDNEAVPKYMLVNRMAWTGSHYYLQNPTVTSTIDVIGTAKFKLIDPGDSTADEQSLVAEGINVIIIMGKSCIFSGVVRRVTQEVQAAFLADVKIRVWEFECDSDLVRLQKTNVTSSALVTDGAVINDTPGNIARRILTPAGTRDSRGVINCVDANITYQLNSTAATTVETVGNQYDHITTIHAQTNYDLRSRSDYLIYPYTLFDGATVVTNSGAVWTNDEFFGNYLFLVSRGDGTSKTFTTNFAVSTSEILVTTASTFFAVNDRVIPSSTLTLPTGLTATTYYVKTVTADHLTLSLTLTGATVTFSDNGTGTLSLIRVAETAGVTTYGKITGNTATAITCAAMVGASTAPTTLGCFIIHRGYLIDFAHDISPPSPIVNLDVNKTCFEYSDNDDKRKLSTKIVASGKDDTGKTISVSVSGVHAYDEDKQFFEDSTFLTYITEGGIYKNGWGMYSSSGGAPLAINEMWLYGWGYKLFTGSAVAFVPPDGASALNGTITTVTDLLTDNSVRYTKLTVGIAGTTGFALDYSDGGTFYSGRFYIDDPSVIGAVGATNVWCLIGEELANIQYVGKSSTCGYYIQYYSAGDVPGTRKPTSTTIKSYPHGVGALVARTIVDGVAVNETTPQVGSPIDLYGLNIDYRTVDSDITYGQLDAYATSLLLGLGNFYGKATTWSPLEYAVVKQTGEFYGSPQTSRSRPIMVGDSITITNFDGDTPSDPYEVVETTIVCNEGRMMIQLGDFEKNAYTTLMSNTNAINNTLT